MDDTQKILEALARMEAKLDKLTAGRPAGPPATSGAVFPPYGRSKGAPIRGASMDDLEYYAGGAQRSLDDPAKSRWHDKERALLAAINAEIERQEKLAGAATNRTDTQMPPPSDDDIPF